MLLEKTHKIIHVDPEQVFKKASEEELDVLAVRDFRNLNPHYSKIEAVMEQYRSTFIRDSALRGLTSGIGGFTTSLTLAGLDTLASIIQLYRLSERFAILNGFDIDDPIQKDETIQIYLTSLGVNSGVLKNLREQLIKTTASTGIKYASDRLLIKLLVRAAKKSSTRWISDNAGKLIPVAGGLVGAAGNYAFANRVSQKMKTEYKKAYFETWGVAPA